ncbi:MAG TPA: DedA family protein, partial [Polyangiaceae bacterium]|nr:DedA family protein [Polyangiaceae bacterium]
WSNEYGLLTYVLLFLIVFCETGLVIMPFLPGDSLLFAAGAVTALEGSELNPVVMMVLLIIAAVLGDAVNYTVGYKVGAKIVAADSRWVKRKHVEAAEDFYKRYGGKAIVIARFAPFLRTFAPFVAGIGRMDYKRFALFNVTGGIAWVASFVLAGYFFGELPFVKKNFKLVILAIIIISLIPPFVEFMKARRASKKPPTDPS